MSDVENEVAAQLATAGVGTVGTDIFLGRGFPHTPDACVLVKAYTGSEPLNTMGAGVGTVTVEKPRLQVSARAATYNAARAKAQAAWDALHMLKGTLSGTAYFLIRALQPVSELYVDENNRVICGANFEAWKEKSA